MLIFIIAYYISNKRKKRYITFIITQIIRKLLYNILWKLGIFGFFVNRHIHFCFFTYSRICSLTLSQYSHAKLCTPANILPVRERVKKTDKSTSYYLYLTDLNRLVWTLINWLYKNRHEKNYVIFIITP